MYYQGQEIKTLYHQGRQITLLYYQGMVVYRIGGPGGETYAIINTLEDAKALLLQDIHFDWVWASDMNKWYRYNNIRQYEEYGIYADTIEPYNVDWVEEDVPETLYQTPIIPTINTRMHIEGTLKHKDAALYYGYTNSDDNKDYRFFKSGNIAYWDMNSSRLNTTITNIKAGDFISMNIGNNFMRGTMGTYNINNATTNPHTTIAAPSYLNINLSAIDIDYFAIYENDEMVYEILKREDGTHYSRYWSVFGTTTYEGKLATVDGIEYQFTANNWEIVGNAVIANADVEIISGFKSSGLIDDTTEYATTSSGSRLKYTIDSNISQFGIYLGLDKKYANEKFTITASEPNSEVVQHQLSRTDKTTFSKYYEYFLYENIQAGDVITIKFTSTYNISSWGGGYTYAPTAYAVDVIYEFPEPLKFREYETYSGFYSDNDKYGDCIVHIIEDDSLFKYDYNKQLSSIDEQIFEYKGTEQVIPRTSSNYVTTLYDSDSGNGRIIYSDIIFKLPDNEFKDNTSLTEYILPSSVVSFGANVFNGCSNLTTFDVGNCKLSTGLFQGTKISNITIDDSSIPASCFQNCRNLQSVTIVYPETISLQDQAFYGSVITDINGSKIRTLGQGAFQEATLPETLYLPNISGTLQLFTFQNAKGLKTITFGPNVTALVESVFAKSSIQSIIFEDAGSISSMHTGTFIDADNVTALRVPNIAVSFRLYAQNTSGRHSTMPLDRDALVQVFNDLATVSGKTLTLGETLLAKLTDEDIAIATSKGWTLA